MKFDVYGRFEVDIVREGGVWVAYRLAEGKRVRDDTLILPAALRPDELAVYLDDLFHELARPGQNVRPLPY